MPLGLLREKVLYGILSKRPRPHRYTVYRWVIGVFFTAAIAALPFTDTLRFDFWSGQHHVLGQQVSLVEAAKAFAFPFLGLNIAIILVSRFFGRYLCGFMCPVGSLSRLGERARFRREDGAPQLVAPLLVFAVCVLLGTIVFNFWVDWGVWREGSTLARLLAGGFLGATVLGLFGIVQGFGLRFCRDWCPSGVYFALLGHTTSSGIEFAHPETCTECKACEKVCPMDLHPTEMSGGAYRNSSGFYGEGMSNFSLCIRCGDCVVACEGVNVKHEEPLPLRMGWLPEGARECRDISESGAGSPGDLDEDARSASRPNVSLRG